MGQVLRSGAIEPKLKEEERLARAQVPKPGPEPRWAPFLPHHTLRPSCPTGLREKCSRICKELLGVVLEHGTSYPSTVDRMRSKSYARSWICTQPMPEPPLRYPGWEQGLGGQRTSLKFRLPLLTVNSLDQFFFSSVKTGMASTKD